MYLVKTPGIIQALFKGFVWKIASSKKVFLTFDDGPIPEVTPWVLDLLKNEGIKATFFCVGENVQKYPAIYQRILDEGHAVGNHTFNHVNGWNTEGNIYQKNVELASEVIDSNLFRPPYGKLLPSQIRALKANYSIIMWDVLSGDFDSTISPEECLRNVKDNAKKGSIIVFHDSLKASSSLKYVLPKVIVFFKEKGITFGKIEDWKDT